MVVPIRCHQVWSRLNGVWSSFFQILPSLTWFIWGVLRFTALYSIKQDFLVKFEWGLIVFFFKFCRFEHDLRGVNCVLLRSTVENRTRTWFYGTSSTSIVEHKRKFNRSGTENFNVAWWFGLGGGARTADIWWMRWSSFGISICWMLSMTVVVFVRVCLEGGEGRRWGMRSSPASRGARRLIRRITPPTKIIAGPPRRIQQMAVAFTQPPPPRPFDKKKQR